MISTNDKVIGISSVDRKDLMKRSADITASMGIPTFIYMFNDAQMMNQNQFRTLLSIIETEETEAKITINFLKEMGYTYVDIWYHKFSEEMATYVYENYVKKVGCGHFAEVSYPLDVPRIHEAYNKSGGHPSEVQLILSNSRSTTKTILTYMISELGFTKKIYILGASNGRKKFLYEYLPILQTSGNNYSLVLPLPPLLNTDLGESRTRLTTNWTKSKDRMDGLYKHVQLKTCPVIETRGVRELSCLWTDWLPYVVTGTEAILQSLHRTLTDHLDFNMCSKKLRMRILDSVVEENRTIAVSMNEDLDLYVSFQNRSINIDYEFGIYRAQTESFDIVGHIHRDKVDITDRNVLVQTQYEKFCSPACFPGQFRLYDDRISHLSCCWTCRQCDNHSITVGQNENKCDRCRPEQTSNDNHTVCLNTELHYITTSSKIFFGTSTVICIGLITVIVISAVIFKNEERPIIKASDPSYLYMILLGLFIGMAASFIPLLKPSLWTCSFEYILVLICSAIITTNLLWKCIKIYGIFESANSFYRKPIYEGLFKRAGQTWLNVGTFSVVLVLTMMDFFTGNGLSWKPNESQLFDHSDRYLVCEGRTGKSLILTALPLAIPTLYFLATLVLAFKMRHFPHNFKETLNIFGATLVVMLCCIMFLSGYNLSHLYLRALLRFIVIFVTCTAFLVCLFVPRIILLVKKHADIEAEKEEIRSSVRKFSCKSLKQKRTPSKAPSYSEINAAQQAEPNSDSILI